MPRGNGRCLGELKRVIVYIHQPAIAPDAIDVTLTIGKAPQQTFCHTSNERVIEVALAPGRERPCSPGERQPLVAIPLGTEHVSNII